MKLTKIKLYITLFIMIIICSGCERAISVEEKEYVLVLGIDKIENNKTENTSKEKEKKWEVFYSKADTSKLQGEAGNIAESTHVSYKVNSLAQSEREDASEDAKQLSLGHLKAIFIGEELAKDEQEWAQLIEELEKTREISKTVLVYLCSPNAKQLIETEKDVSGTLGDYVEQLSQKQERQNKKKAVTLNDIIVKTNENSLNRNANNIKNEMLENTKEKNIPIEIPILTTKEKRPIMVKE